ncbi:LPS export ABC transporter periplasmic protein LptC [Roseovarius sp. A21]|uniref:LPS export ABC transporter periplasmic protein LptC n=1 Tax=Roseovarius bejariae TaxID=2576383 RepID=A0A844CY95_9RHOB|nr:LPS export ABC transporter periplasmic protein LptC [Roseovarius bejariae]MRU15610.1 LPS export ABC transporter periplasmic protein LptC [Roseovarius bejariae]
MLGADNFHSRLVAWMKIILPLLALGLLSTLFLISRTVDPTKNIPITSIDLEQRADDLGATNPSFAGVTNRGDQISVRADQAKPDANDPEHLMARTVVAQLRLTSGTVIDITSNRAEMNQGTLTANLEGAVHVVTTNGYDLTTERLNTRLDRLFAETPGPVQGAAPVGTIEAGRMLLQTNDDSGAAHLLFTDGVKLLYTPQNVKE